MLTEYLTTNAFALFFVFARIGSALMLLPGFGEVFIPARALHSVRNVHAGTSRWLYGYA